MFHTFQSTVALKSPGADGGAEATKPTRPAGSRRISTSNACVECRRRKIRCDGTQPCGQCQWYQHPELCNYSKPAQRVVPSRKLVDKLQQSIEQYKAIVTRLYPSKDIESLTALPREQLLDLALSTPALSSTSPESSGVHPIIKPETPSRSDGAESLEALEQAPDENPEWDEARKHQVKIQGISDDINGLSMAVDRHSSYVGISSITAALKVIIRIAPHTRSFVVQSFNETALPSRANSPPGDYADDDPYYLPPQPVAHKLLDSYFDKVHVFFPMIDERKFWTTFLYGERKDAPWLALINIVFALGSLASSTADNQEHYAYFARSRQHLSLESFGSGSLEVLQCLGIMSGWYMHYLNRPNEAHSLMGGALRMATALGLHREYMEPTPQNIGGIPSARSLSDAVSAEMRRRIWWSLFCLDSWASTTTGRPSLGRMGPSITVQLPGKVPQSEHVFQPNSPQNLEALKIVPLIYFGEFCKIATRIQDRLIEQPLLRFDELSQFDQDLVRWHEDLPSILSNLDESCPSFLSVIRLVMKWRFQNLRLVLHRPSLLSCALRRTPFASLSPEDKVAVGKCRIIAGKAIEEISSECPGDLISGWNGVWFVYQACMVPLVSLFSDTSIPEEVEKWKTQIETALLYFERIKRFSIAAKRSQDAVARLYDAFKTLQEQAAIQAQVQAQRQHLQAQQQQQHQQKHQRQPVPPPQDMSAMHGMQTIAEAMNPDMGSLRIGTNMGMAGGVWQDPSSGLSSISGFWDEMMWDTNFPDMPDNDYLLGEFDFNAQAQDGSAAPGEWPSYG